MDRKVKLLKALAHNTRLEIVEKLLEKNESCLCELQNQFESSQSNLSQHLKILKEADILDSNKIGGWVYYSVKNRVLMESLIKNLNLLKEI